MNGDGEAGAARCFSPYLLGEQASGDHDTRGVHSTQYHVMHSRARETDRSSTRSSLSQINATHPPRIPPPPPGVATVNVDQLQSMSQRSAVLSLPRTSVGALDFTDDSNVSSPSLDQPLSAFGCLDVNERSADAADYLRMTSSNDNVVHVRQRLSSFSSSFDSSTAGRKRPADLRHECSLSWQHVSFIVPAGKRKTTGSSSYDNGIKSVGDGRGFRRWLPFKSRAPVDLNSIACHAQTPSSPSMSPPSPSPSPSHKILNNIWGRSAPGELTAIIGPSGAGKSTLLDVLAGRVASSPSSARIQGQIDVNGRARDLRTFRAVMSYVAQETAFLGAFTVLETLQFAAGLSLPGHVPLLTREMRVQDVVDAMGLRACARTPVGDVFHKGISGGQRRRLAIAVELLANPSVLLLDEPTSGLDASSARRVMEHIALLCRDAGKNVVCAIHQPSSAVFALLTNLAVLSKGELVYFGRARAAVAHFGALGFVCPVYSNPAEYFVHLVNADFFSGDRDRQSIDLSLFMCALECSDSFRAFKADVARDRAEANGQNLLDDHGESRRRQRRDVLRFLDDRALLRALRPSRWTQFGVLLHRAWLNNWRHPGVFWVRVLMYLLLALMAGSMFHDSVDGANGKADPRAAVPLLFYLQAFLVFMSVAALPALLEQRAVFEREAMNTPRLHAASYAAATLLAALPGIFFIALLATVVVVTLAGVRAFGAFLLNLTLSLVVAESCMHALAAAVPHYIVGIALGAGLFGMFMLCEGFLVPRPNMPRYWVWGNYLAFHSYSFEAFMFEHMTAVGTPAAHQVLVEYGMEDTDVANDMLVLVAYALALQLVVVAVLTIRRSKRVGCARA